jgi:hypothetical protein
MFFKVNTTGVSERKGLVEVRYDLYLDPSDERYSEHYVQVPVIPKEGYTGKVDEEGNPIDQVDYDKWLDGLERVYQHNPFCCHFCQFEPNVTDAEIEYVGKLALDMKYKDWVVGSLARTKNEPVTFSTNPTKITACATRVATIKETTWTAVSLEKVK